MQKRKGRGSLSLGSDMLLPLTTSDTSPKKTNTFFNKNNNRQHTLRTRHEKRRSGSSTWITCVLFLFVMACIGLLLTHKFDFVSHNPVTNTGSVVVDPSNDILTSAVGQQLNSLAQFKSVEKPLSHAKLVGLYFAASWCGMSTPVSNKLEQLFDASAGADTDATSLSNRILTSQDIDNGLHKDFSLVYISSDNTAEDMEKYTRPNWIPIPFDSPDRNDLKRHYRACAEVEMEGLEITPRRYNIPTLLIVDSVTHGIITSNGAQDLEEYGAEVLDHWLQVQSLTRALEDKYDEE
mmetsp:Transcript_14457/g.21680  ORF Transcript_14457/g.21680 Transcript_14457/m.21680 type:complete len:293 (+) Transcript_14457:82-960(+)